MNSTDIAIVDIEWIKMCLVEQRYLLPNKFSIRLENKPSADTAPQKMSIEQLEKQMNRLDSSEKMHSYLQNCMIYLFKLDAKEEAIQKRLIHIGGGA